MAHYQILDKTANEIAILINPAAYKFRLFSGSPHPDAVLALNINYSWLGIAIGYVRSGGFNRILTLSDKCHLRPCICIEDNGIASIRKFQKSDDIENYQLIAQAGPTLVESNKIVATQSAKLEEFRHDATRKTIQVAIGTTQAGKIIAACVNKVSLEDLAYYMQQKGAVNAMKCDGGNASALWFRSNSQEYKYGSNTNCRAGLQFITK